MFHSVQAGRTSIDKGMKATIEMEGFNANEYGYLQGRVSRTDKRVFRCGGTELFPCNTEG